jgi:histone-lysine N-methyltransferase SETMAR
VQLKDVLKEKRCGKFTNEVLFLHDNALGHWALATQKKVAYLGFHCLDHLPYSLDLAPSHYHPFHGLKITIERSPFFVRHGGHCCCGDLVGQTTFWIFLSASCKS